MKALRWTGIDRISFEDIDEPVVRNTDAVKVRVSRVGVCTTDFHIIEGSFGDNAPLTMGHEIAGTVLESGPDTLPRSVEYLQTGVVNLDPMVTHVYEASEFERAFRYAQANGEDHVKTVVRF